MGLRKFLRGEEKKEEKIQVVCDAELVIRAAQGWYKNGWGKGDVDLQHSFSRFFRFAEESLEAQSNSSVYVQGMKDSVVHDANGDGGWMTFKRSDIFHGLWLYIRKPTDEKPGYKKISKCCLKKEADVKLQFRYYS